MQIREILDHKTPHAVYNVSVNETVHSAARQMTEKKVGALAVLNKNSLVGVVSERDVLTKVVSPSLDPHRVTVGEVMSTDLVVAEPDETFEQCEIRMKRAGCRHILIVESQRLIGMISLRDILSFSIIEKVEPVLVPDELIWTLPSESG